MPVISEGYALFVHLIMIIAGGAFGGFLEFLNRFVFGVSGATSPTNSSNSSANRNGVYDDTLSTEASNTKGKSELRFGDRVNEIHDAEFLYGGLKFYKGHLSNIFYTHVLHGIGGAFAVLFALSSINQFSYELDIENKLFLISLYIVAGYAGSRILDHVKNNIENQLKENNINMKKMQKTTEELSDKLNNLRREIALEAEAGDVLNRAHGILEKEPTEIKKSTADIEHIARDLHELLGRGDNLSRLMLRRCAIYLGRIYRKYFVDLHRGIAALQIFIDYSDAQGLHDEDYAAVMFNIACYKSILATQGECTDKAQVLKEVDSLLKKAISASHAIKDQVFGNSEKNIVADEDLSSYRDWLETNK